MATLLMPLLENEYLIRKRGRLIFTLCLYKYISIFIWLASGYTNLEFVSIFCRMELCCDRSWGQSDRASLQCLHIQRWRRCQTCLVVQKRVGQTYLYVSHYYFMILKYGFCKKLLLYECNSDQLNTIFIKIRFALSPPI